MVVALGIGVVAVTIFPHGPNAPSTTTATGSATILIAPNIPVALAGYLSAQNVMCSLSTGVCAFTIVNNSTTPLALETCHVASVTSSGGTVVTVLVNGTIGGSAAVAGIPANSQTEATCTVPTVQFASETAGSAVSGSFTVKLLTKWYSYPAGDEATFVFAGTWTTSTNTDQTTQTTQTITSTCFAESPPSGNCVYPTNILPLGPSANDTAAEISSSDAFSSMASAIPLSYFLLGMATAVVLYITVV